VSDQLQKHPRGSRTGPAVLLGLTMGVGMGAAYGVVLSDMLIGLFLGIGSGGILAIAFAMAGSGMGCGQRR